MIINGRRTWLVSGTIHYARVPRGLWADRLRAARQAGLNCIETAAVWSVHEPQPEVFRFDDDADLRHFVELIGEMGMYCVLRAGPFIGDGFDLGGLPAWLLDGDGTKLRQSDPAFLQAVARYLDAVMGQVAKLQASESKPGPIIAVQNEHEWFCHNEAEAEDYLQQISRFLREGGCNVPLLNRNNLFQQVAGTIDTWAGESDLLANCRQLRVVQPGSPCIVSSLPAGAVGRWDRACPDQPDADAVLRRMAEVTAAGAMFNLDPFCGGTNLGFLGGRLADGDDGFVTTSHDCAAPLSETGQRTDKYARVKRLATFITQFEPLLTNTDTSNPHAVAATGVGVAQLTGSLGKAVFVLRDDRTASVELTTPDGQSLDVHFGKDPVAWLLLNANLQGVATLDLTNLRPFAFLGRRMLVLFGPAGTEGLVSIDGALRAIDVPAGNEPVVFADEDLTVVVLNEKQVDAAYLADDVLHVGVDGLDAEGEPVDHPAFATRYTVALDGEVASHRRAKAPKLTAPKLDEWWVADTASYVTGKAPRYATLDGPKSLEACGADFGYGWYRIRTSRSRAKKAKLLAPQAADRLHLYRDGKPLTVLGSGPGANDKPVAFDLPAGDSDLIILADNLGRFSEDLMLGRPSGLFGHLAAVKPVRLNNPKTVVEPRYDPFELTGYVPLAAHDDRTPMPRYLFDFKLPSRQPHVLTLAGERPRCVILVNNKPVAIDVGHAITAHYCIEEELKKGANRIVLAMIDPVDDGFDPKSIAKLHRVEDKLTEGADFWYARWQMPDDNQYTALDETDPPAGPAFFAASFAVDHTDAPLLVEIVGGTKGQLYLNGHNLGRYFVATATGKKVPAQPRYYLPEPLLLTADEGDNELIFFDEHGKAPTKSKLVYDA